ncbi:MAG: polysaccharide biosynthesis tyrosine autokinase [Limisphaerales bacterium]
MLPNDPQYVGLDYDQPQTEFSLQYVFRLLIENLWIILALLAAALAYSYYEIQTTPVRYKSTGSLQVEMNTARSALGMADLDADPLAWRDPMLFNSLSEEITTKDSVKNIALNMLDRLESGQLKNDKVNTWLNGVSERDKKLANLRMQVSRRVRAAHRKSTSFIDVTATDDDPQIAQMIAQEAILGFVQFQKMKRKATRNNATDFLRTEIPNLRIKSDDADRQLASFLRTNTISVGKDEMAGEELKARSERLYLVQENRQKLQNDWDAMQAIGNDPAKLVLVPSVAKTETVAELRKRIADQQNEIVNLQQRYRAKHPKMIEAVTLMQSLTDRLNDQVLAAPAVLAAEMKQLQLEESQLQLAVKEWEKKVKEVSVKRLVYTRLSDAAQTARDLYQSAVRGLAQREVLQKEKQDDNHLVSSFNMPKVPDLPYQPNKERIIATYVALGLAISFSIIYLLHTLDTTIKSVDQAERLFGIPVLGSIPRSSDIRGDKQRLILSSDPNSLCSEAFRTLRAAIGLLGRDDERKVTLFTSAVPAEGKTFCSANFALSCANQGQKTLIVDFDLRRPSVGDTFGIDADQIGVSDCLLGKTTIEEAALVSEYENLHIMPAGTMVPNPSELIASKHTKDFIETAIEKYDKVVIDNAPVTAVSDTLLILHCVDTVCLVTRAAKTSYRLVGRALELIRRGGVTPSGVVLNFVPQRGRSGYYYYYHSDKSYYGGYGPEKKKKSKSAH